MSNPIKNAVKSFLDKSLSEVGANTQFSTTVIVKLLIEAAITHDSMKEIARTPDSDSVFKRLEHATLELINAAFEQHIRALFKNTGDYFRRGKVYLAFDETYEEYFGKQKTAWIWGYKPKKGATGCFKFLVVSIVKNNRRYVLGAVPVHIGYNKEKTVALMLEFTKKFVSIKAILFDKGFYSAKLVEQLENNGYSYVILVPKNKKTKKYLEQEGSTFEHDMQLRNKQGKYWLNLKIKVARNVYEHNWMILTNLDYRNTTQLVNLYKKRWNIENVFRITDKIRLRTNSTNIVIKTIFFIVALIIYNVWQWFRQIVKGITLRRFTKNLLKLAKQLLEEETPPIIANQIKLVAVAS